MNKPSIEFVEFPKIARLNREVIVTEKIDGTNAQIYIPEGRWCECGHENTYHQTQTGTGLERCRPLNESCACAGFKPFEPIFAGSRTKWITPEDDNHGFARWVEANKAELLKLGPGQHFGEWWGSGIQRGYGLTKGEKRFSLFNTHRWGDPAARPSCCHVVPVLWAGMFEQLPLENVLGQLRAGGSIAAPGFKSPEGIVIYHVASRQLFKKTLVRDESPKGKVAE